jgi:hypothetical protein
MDIPGLDLLTSNPEAVIYTGWMTANLPGSAALINGGRRVMTEVSDFSETMAKRGPASVADMCATAAWQAAFGVTEFTLYYNRGQRSSQEYRRYCTYVGRLNALLRDAQPMPRVLLYYPIMDVWADYTPIAEKLTLESQPRRLQDVVNAFMGLGQRMTRTQIAFALADHEVLAAARGEDGRLWVEDRFFTTLVLPAGAELPASVEKNIKAFETSGGKVLREMTAEKMDASSLAAVYECGCPTVSSERLVVGRFARDGRAMLLIVNVGGKAYGGAVTAPHPGRWLTADPDTGKVSQAKVAQDGQVAVSLPPRGATILIGPPSGSED